MADRPLPEETLQARFGVSAFVLEKARHLRDAVFPYAGVTLYIQEQWAYAVTSERALVPVALLESLAQMTDAEVSELIERQLVAHQQDFRRPLRELRVEAGFLTKYYLSYSINERFAKARTRTIM